MKRSHPLFASLTLALLGLLLSLAPLSATPLMQEETEEEEEDAGTAYSDVITEDAVTTRGLFDTHMVDGDLFYEVPLDMLDREQAPFLQLGNRNLQASKVR